MIDALLGDESRAELAQDSVKSALVFDDELSSEGRDKAPQVIAQKEACALSHFFQHRYVPLFQSISLF